MFFDKKKEMRKVDEPDGFGYTSKYITDELELIQDQQENIIRVGEELEKALSDSDKIKELIKVVRKIDQTILEKQVGERRKQESKLINMIEDVKELIKNRRYEDIDKMMLQVQQESQLKIKLSQEELQNLRGLLDQVVELYKEAAGLCRLYTMVYDQVKIVYEQCARELGIETTEEEELSRASVYKDHIH